MLKHVMAAPVAVYEGLTAKSTDPSGNKSLSTDESAIVQGSYSLIKENDTDAKNLCILRTGTFIRDFTKWVI